MATNQLRTRQEVLAEVSRKGISISELARRIGYDRMTVYHVLHTDKPCKFGKSHKVAVALGIKEGEIEEDQGQ